MKKRWIGVGILIVLGAGFELSQLFGETTAFTSFVSNSIFKNNLHPVVPGELYRSSQMSPEDMHATIRSLGLKSVVDLRFGKEEPGEVTEYEEDVVKSEGAEYIHFPLLGSREIPLEKLEELLQLFGRLKKPALVHCSSGTHRSGVVSSLFLLTQKGDDGALVEEQLSTKYGYIRLEREFKGWLQGYPTIDHTIWEYLRFRRKSGGSVAEWIESRKAAKLGETSDGVVGGNK